MIKQFSTKERSELNLCKLDNYCLFIASLYFESIEDHKNFIKTTKKLQYNLDKFYYNPISINSLDLHYFQNIQTFHLYDIGDDFLEEENIFEQYVLWNIQRAAWTHKGS
jgi:hypothetical protein